LNTPVPTPHPSGLRFEYDAALPIVAHKSEILEAVRGHPVVVVCGATGSGKSTQLPKFCLEAGSGKLIGHTQPRRIAARALAARVAQELGASIGGAVGYKVRFNERTGPQCQIKLMTDGILLKELENDRTLSRYDTLIIDEAHERSLNIDLLLGVLKTLLPKRPDLRLIVTSATIDPGKFAAFFDGAPVIEVSGRSYPVEVRYRPAATEEEGTGGAVVEAVRELDADGGAFRGDTLVFLPGEKHIRETLDDLEKARLANTEILPLFARLSTRDQERIFERHTTRRIILATNVAETSLTVPGIRYVIDSGLARISRYSVRGKVQRLPIERISKASADQRKGRCGREAEGICVRLFSEEDFGEREDFTPPEVLRTNLASVILRMATIGLGEPESFPFVDRPDTRLVNDGVRLLQELKAMDESRRVTSLGRKIAALPVDPRLGRMLLAASHNACLTEMLVIAAFLEAQDPRERPRDAQQQSAEKHALFADERSDFIGVLNLWRGFNEQSTALSGSQLRKWCREHFLSFVRMREWQDLHSQLSEAAGELDLHPNEVPAGYPELHQAILTGFLGSIGRLDEKREYDGPRGSRFVIAPGTPLAAKPPKWVVAGSLVETTRVYARMVASVNPMWIESAGAHLLNRTYSEPHWVRSGGFVAALESVSLYGLTLAAQRRVNFGVIQPAAAREIFIRQALVSPDPVEEEFDTYVRRGKGRGREPMKVHGEFLQANTRLREQIEALEAKIRRRDVLVDEQTQVDFYSARLPERVNSIALFDRWRADAERGNPRILYFTRADLLRREVPEAGPDQYPDDFPLGANRLPLIYRFEPGEADDGVTLVAPEPLVDLLQAEQLAWLVPGLRLEKVTELFRALPKAQRKLLVPVPEHAREALRELLGAEDGVRERSGAGLPGFYTWLAGWITQRTGTPITPAQLAALEIPAYLRMNIRVVDADDKVIAEGRDLVRLRAAVTASSQRAQQHVPLQTVHRQWDFGDLPESVEVHRNRLHLQVFPAVEDRGSGVAVVEARSAAAADSISRHGIVRLAMLALPQHARYVHKRFADDRELILLSRGLTLALPLADALTQRSFRECLLPSGTAVPRSRAEFEELLESRRSEVSQEGDRLAVTVQSIVKEWRAVRAALEGIRSATFAEALADVNAQLQQLLPPDFLTATERPWLDYLPRYLKAIARRLDRLPGNLKRDMELSGIVKPFAAAFRELAARPSTALAAREGLDSLRWMIEEFRVSLFAQDLKTVTRVSEKRLTEQLELVRVKANG
jgi:ATP-dependent helicase HrpA